MELHVKATRSGERVGIIEGIRAWYAQIHDKAYGERESVTISIILDSLIIYLQTPVGKTITSLDLHTVLTSGRMIRTDG